MNEPRQRRTNYCLRLCVVLRWCLLCSCFPLIGSLSLKPPAEEILNNHLCPDPVLPQGSRGPGIFQTSSKIMSVSLQRSPKPKDRSNSYFSRFRPCTFVEDPSTPLRSFLSPQDNPITDINATIVRIKSINLHTTPWNFTTSSRRCSKFIMFRSWAEYGNGFPVMCGRDNFESYLGPFGNPMILYYHIKNQGISFPLFHPNYAQHSRDQKNIFELKYMLIYYSVKKDDMWTCRIQQYTLDPLLQGCPPPVPNETICGEYNCSELEALYQKKMGVTGDGEFHQQRFIIVKSKTQERYRVRNFLRQKFVPIVFILVLIFAYKSYMKAGLRFNDPLPLPVTEMRIRRYQQRHHQRYLGESGSRDHFRDIYFDYGESEHIPGFHIPYEPSATGGISPLASQEETGQHCPHNPGKCIGHGVGGTDPPPAYESLFPPTYTEATAASPKHLRI